MPRELLGTSVCSDARMKCPPCGRGMEENEGENLKLLCPHPEGMIESDTNLRSPGSQLKESSSSSSLEEAGLKVLENSITAESEGGSGNMMVQQFGNVSTMAWTTPAKPYQSECLAQTGQTHSSPIICQTLIWNWNTVLRAFAIRGPWALMGTCFWRVSCILLRKTSTAFLAWARTALRVASKRQMTGSLWSSALIASFHFCSSLAWAASHSSWASTTAFMYSFIALCMSS